MIRVVTSFSPQGYAQYGKRFIDSFLRFWGATGDVEMHVFLEGQTPPIADYIAHPNIGMLVWHNLRDNAQHEEFVTRWSGPKWNDPHDFNMMPVKFCHKVFAITSPSLPLDGWRVWIDADVVTTALVTSEWLQKALPSWKAIAYLGRTGFMRPGQPMYSECGFVGYNLDHPWVQAVLHDMRAIYTTGKLFGLGKHNWHDSYVFDHCLGKHLTDERRAALHNLSEHHAERCLYPWDETLLADVMEHHKGPRRKLAAYGRS